MLPELQIAIEKCPKKITENQYQLLNTIEVIDEILYFDHPISTSITTLFDYFPNELQYKLLKFNFSNKKLGKFYKLKKASFNLLTNKQILEIQENNYHKVLDYIKREIPFEEFIKTFSKNFKDIRTHLEAKKLGSSTIERMVILHYNENFKKYVKTFYMSNNDYYKTIIKTIPEAISEFPNTVISELFTNKEIKELFLKFNYSKLKTIVDIKEMTAEELISFLNKIDSTLKVQEKEDLILTISRKINGEEEFRKLIKTFRNTDDLLVLLKISSSHSNSDIIYETIYDKQPNLFNNTSPIVVNIENLKYFLYVLEKGNEYESEDNINYISKNLIQILRNDLFILNKEKKFEEIRNLILESKYKQSILEQFLINIVKENIYNNLGFNEYLFNQDLFDELVTISKETTFIIKLSKYVNNKKNTLYTINQVINKLSKLTGLKIKTKDSHDLLEQLKSESYYTLVEQVIAKIEYDFGFNEAKKRVNKFLDEVFSLKLLVNEKQTYNYVNDEFLSVYKDSFKNYLIKKDYKYKNFNLLARKIVTIDGGEVILWKVSNNTGTSLYHDKLFPNSYKPFHLFEEYNNDSPEITKYYKNKIIETVYEMKH